MNTIRIILTTPIRAILAVIPLSFILLVFTIAASVKFVCLPREPVICPWNTYSAENSPVNGPLAFIIHILYWIVGKRVREGRFFGPRR